MSAVPKLRFGDYKTSWRKTVLGEIANFRRGSFPQPYGLSKWYDDENGYPFVQVFDVDKSFKLKTNTKKMISKLATKQSVFVKKDSILLTIQGSIGRIAITQYDAYVDRTLLIFQSFNQPLDKRFFAYVVYLLFEKEKRLAPGGTIKTITKESLSSFNFLCPTLPEQKKIADFLGAVDEKLRLLRARHDALNDYKKGVMQQIFAQTLRFKADDGNDFPNWEKKTLGEICEFMKDGTHGTHQDTIDAPYLLLSAKNIQKGGVVYDHKDRRIAKTEFDAIYKNYSLKNGDILLTVVGTIGRVAIFDGAQNIAFQRSVAFFRLAIGDAKYFYQYMTGQIFQRELKRRLVVSAQPGIYLGDLAKISILFPHQNEQKKIANFLSALDAKISAVSSQIIQMQDFKKGLLQQMFV